MEKSKLFVAILLVAAIGAAIYLTIFNGSSASGNDTQIQAFGDSLTYGKGDRDSQGYIGDLEKTLNQKYPDRNFTIKNYGVPGRESGGVLKELVKPSTAGELKNANYFIVFIGTNDLIHSNGGDLKQIDAGKIQDGQENYLKNMKMIIKILTKANETAPILVVGLYNPVPGNEEIETFIDEWNQETIKLLKKENRVEYVPTNDLFKGKDKQKYFSDSLHLNDNGYNLIKNEILSEYKFN